jgi:hypothetical protein
VGRLLGLGYPFAAGQGDLRLRRDEVEVAVGDLCCLHEIPADPDFAERDRDLRLHGNSPGEGVELKKPADGRRAFGGPGE